MTRWKGLRGERAPLSSLQGSRLQGEPRKRDSGLRFRLHSAADFPPSLRFVIVVLDTTIHAGTPHVSRDATQCWPLHFPADRTAQEKG